MRRQMLRRRFALTAGLRGRNHTSAGLWRETVSHPSSHGWQRKLPIFNI